jgi:acyl dehydratase
MSGAITARWTPRQADIDRFAELSGDDNPIHLDPAFSARTSFGRTVAHGMLLYSRVWALIVEARPSTRHVFQALMFPAPAYADEELEIAITPKEEPSPIVPSGVAPEARTQLAGEGQGTWDGRRAALYAIRVARVRDGAEALTGECTLEEAS